MFLDRYVPTLVIFFVPLKQFPLNVLESVVKYFSYFFRISYTDFKPITVNLCAFIMQQMGYFKFLHFHQLSNAQKFKFS